MLAQTAGSVQFRTEFRQYASAVAFLQIWPDGANGTSTSAALADSSCDVIAHFPAFGVDAADSKWPFGKRGYANWDGQSVPNKHWMTSLGSTTAAVRGTGVWPPLVGSDGHDSNPANTSKQPSSILTYGYEAAGALAIFDSKGQVTTVMSPFAAFDTTNIAYTPPVPAHGDGDGDGDGDGRGGVLSYGPRGSIESLPEAYTSGVIIQAGSGIRHTMRDWGLALMKKGGKNPDLWKEDFSLRFLGYTTDNGAYYYYNTEPGKNYEDTILDLKAYTVEAKIPVRWILYDSWFYKKLNDTHGGPMYSPSKGALNWTDADPAIFPSGLRAMYKATGWPVVGHGRAWARGNVYEKDYEWIQGADLTGEVIALPRTIDFWDFLFQNAREWGLLQYQQDWMFTQARQEQVLKSATIGREWRKQMTDSLDSHGMRFGYGGVMGADWLMGTEQQAVTNGRVSSDYHANLTPQLNSDNWDIGVASIFCWALSTIPAKDGYWTTPEQPGNPYHKKDAKDNRAEPFGDLHSVVATLSRGPVSPADKIGLFNRTMIMRSCMDDGTLLQPDLPARALDSQMVQSAFGTGGPKGGIWTTYSTIGGVQYHHVLVPMLAEPYTLTAAELTAEPDTSLGGAYTVVIENARGGRAAAPALFGADQPLRIPSCDQGSFKLYHTVPMHANGWGYAGELDKWVPVSTARVRSIATRVAITARLSGTPGESTSVTFVNQQAPKGPLALHTIQCTFGQTGVVDATPQGCQAL